MSDDQQLPKGASPPSGAGDKVVYVNTGGGTYVAGSVTVEGGDFVGRDQTKTPGTRESSAAPRVYAPLLIWADLPLSLPRYAPRNRALAIQEMQEHAADLPPLPFDFPALPPVCILSFDPTNRVEQAFTAAERALAVILTRQNVPPRMGCSLLKMAGDLESRTGLWLGWDDAANVHNDRNKTHLLKEAQRHADDNTVVLLARHPDEGFAKLWPLLRPLIQAAQQAYVVGPEGYEWPAPLIHAGSDPERVLDLLPRVEPRTHVVRPPAEPAPGSSLEPAILQHLERLLAGQAELKRGQYAIYRRLTVSERRQVAELREALVGVQGNTAALRDLRQLTDGLRRALRDLRDRQLGSVESEVHEILQEVTEILGADVGVTTELELLIPFLPFLLKVDLGGSIDVRELVEQLIARLRGQRGRQDSRAP